MISVNTEITDAKAKNGWVLYDGECRICLGVVRRWGRALRERGFECIPLQTPWVREQLNLPDHILMREMRVLNPAGKVIGGADAVLLLARTFWWAAPLVWLTHLPGVHKLLDALYRWGAARRYCFNGACELRAAGHGHQYRLFLAALPLCVWFIMRDAPGWMLMWGMAFALWFALKIFTFLDLSNPPLGRSLAYLLAWPGLDAPEFFRSRRGNEADPSREWGFAILTIACGLGLLFAGARAAYPHSPLLAGWIGMIGMVLVLHFGTFKFLVLLWRRLGLPATPIMQAPLRSRTLAEFWGRRWNTGFSIPARRYLMEPIARRIGTTAGLLVVFLVSGLVHELVISVPAKAGYGLPTLYFLFQAVGMVWERRAGGGNRASALLCVALPAFILFHPPFVHRVILPFLNVIGAL